MEIIKNIEITGAENKKVVADVFYNKTGKKKPVIIFSHGFKGFKDWGTFNLVAKEFARQNFCFIKFNFSHNGTSPENPTEFTDLEAFKNNTFTKELTDLEKVIDWVLQTDLIPEFEKDENNLCLLGHSRGGGISILKAAEDNRVNKLVTWAAVSDFNNRWDEKTLELWQKDGIIYTENKRTGQQMPLSFDIIKDLENNADRLDIKSAIEKLKIPVMIVHGTEDESVDFEEAINLKSWNKNVKLILIPNASHTFGGKHPYNDTIMPQDLSIAITDTVTFLKS